MTVASPRPGRPVLSGRRPCSRWTLMNSATATTAASAPPGPPSRVPEGRGPAEVGTGEEGPSKAVGRTGAFGARGGREGGAAQSRYDGVVVAGLHADHQVGRGGGSKQIIEPQLGPSPALQPAPPTTLGTWAPQGARPIPVQRIMHVGHVGLLHAKQGLVSHNGSSMNRALQTAAATSTQNENEKPSQKADKRTRVQ